MHGVNESVRKATNRNVCVLIWLQETGPGNSHDVPRPNLARLKYIHRSTSFKQNAKTSEMDQIEQRRVSSRPKRRKASVDSDRALRASRYVSSSSYSLRTREIL